jgi:hypothetical protein
MARAAERAIYIRQKRCANCGRKSLFSNRKCERCVMDNRIYQRKRYKQLKRAKLCVQCTIAKVSGSYARCDNCRAVMRSYQQRLKSCSQNEHVDG